MAPSRGTFPWVTGSGRLLLLVRDGGGEKFLAAHCSKGARESSHRPQEWEQWSVT